MKRSEAQGFLKCRVLDRECNNNNPKIHGIRHDKVDEKPVINLIDVISGSEGADLRKVMTDGERKEVFAPEPTILIPFLIRWPFHTADCGPRWSLK